jgi:hypothetical protein
LPTDPNVISCPGCVISCSVTTTSHTAGSSCTTGQSQALSPGTTYFWQVQAWNTNGTQGNYSASRNFSTATSLLPAPTLSSPSNGATGVSTTPGFSWSSVTGANRYWLTVATSNGTLPTDPNVISCPGCVISCSVTTTSHTAGSSCTTGQSQALSSGTTYFWRVQGWNTNGTQGNYSSIFQFQVTAGAADIRIEPLSLYFPTTPQRIQAGSGEGSVLRPGAGGAAPTAEASVFAGDPVFERALDTVGKDGRLNVEGLLLQGEVATSTLALQRFEIWRPDAVVMIGDQRVSVPRTRYFRGSVVGYPDSSVLLSVREKGGVMGMVLRADGAWAIGKGSGQGLLRSRKADPASFRKHFECGLNGLAQGSGSLAGEEALASLARGNTAAFDQPYLATIALDTDYEYYAKFLSAPDPQAAALDAMADLIGYADLVYSREIDTDMAIGFARLWNGGANSDPWTATADTATALTEFRSYWNLNHQSVKRTAVHLLSGKNLGGGRASNIGRLCDNFIQPGNSEDYAVSGDLEGNFDWDGDPSQNPSAIAWDIYVVSHEIGHLFNSPHTQEYCNLEGSSQPIDRCYAGCAGAATGLPTCSSPTPFFNGGAGTIMSYCHQVTGGVGNIAMTFGEGHTCGTLPGREADRMSAHVVARAGAFPACFQKPGGTFTIYNDGSGGLTVSSLALDTPAPWIHWTPAAPYSIPGGGSQVVTVSVDLSSAPAGRSIRRILVTSNDPDENPYPGGVYINVDGPQATCYSLSLTHTGSGVNPLASPLNSASCAAGQYTAGESIQVTASPAAGWSVGSWGGTTGNGSTATTNTVTMPASNHTVTVNYLQAPPTCYTLSLTHTGLGTDPSASPSSSTGCTAGKYTAGESIQVTASPAAGWSVESWSGTADNGSSSTTNTVSMPASSHTASVNYAQASTVFEDGFEGGDTSRWSFSSSAQLHPMLGVWRGTVAGYAAELTVARSGSAFVAQLSMDQANEPVEELNVLSVTETDLVAYRPADDAQLRLSRTQSGPRPCLLGDSVEAGSSRPISLCKTP